MTKHLFGLVLTPLGTAANNRGESEGNITTLQKVLWKGQTHSTVSAEAIRAALRAHWQVAGQPVNRRWDEERRSHTWEDQDFVQGAAAYVDDDILGFMSARAAKTEANEAESDAAPSRGRRTKPRGTTDVRRARLEVTRAISLDPWWGEVVFNAASPGATPAASRTGRDPVPYGAEVHATRYQYGFALTPDSLHDPARAGLVLDAVVGLCDVAGNHARFLYDFAPAAIVLRWTDDPAPRFLYAFEVGEDGVRAPRLLELVGSGDIDASELFLGGEITRSTDGGSLLEAGATVSESVKGAAEAVRQAMAV